MLTRWNHGHMRPQTFGAFSDLRREMDRLFSDFDRTWFGPHVAGRPGRMEGHGWVPEFELSDEGDALRVRVEVPGFAEDDLQIDLDRATLTVRGQRDTSVPEGYSVHRQERGSLAFARTVTLPCAVVRDEVKAQLRDGVLEIEMPKAPEEKPRTIAVKAAN